MNNKNTEIKANDHLDITSERCPMTFVKTKIRLEKMKSGEILEVLLQGEEPLKNVPRSAEELGHRIILNEAVDRPNCHRLMIVCK